MGATAPTLEDSGEDKFKMCNTTVTGTSNRYIIHNARAQPPRAGPAAGPGPGPARPRPGRPAARARPVGGRPIGSRRRGLLEVA